MLSLARFYGVFARILVIVLLLLVSGCASSPEPEATTSATPVEGPAEIPIPPGFQKLDEESVLISFGGFQAGLVVYEGKRKPSWVAEFYRGLLPSQGWSLVASFISKDTILLFTKDHQACVISVSGSQSSARLEVRVGVVEPFTATPPSSSRSPYSAPIPSR